MTTEEWMAYSPDTHHLNSLLQAIDEALTERGLKKGQLLFDRAGQTCMTISCAQMKSQESTQTQKPKEKIENNE